ncbi:MAG: 30S ribosomal protein S8 [Candidatus Shapirobacteria bacterium]|nr:30S ribosomal protein S8 [Candidatus Shapirobacteria bacterium]MDD5073919.1 30S ribosomal protein S8 [Candidatus Shapirobacteria bacterium]MDD5481565.1 30S ribosomal protein S8 [Candidatus Shapirobacteria bacterium]
MSQDTIANFLSALRNAYAAGKNETQMPFSGFNLNLAQILVKERYLTKVEKVAAGKNIFKLVITLNNPRDKKRRPITNIKRISKSGVRHYVSVEELAGHNRRLGTVVISTPKGLMTTKEAKKNNLGGELICRVW